MQTRWIKNPRVPGARLALGTALWVAACDGSSWPYDADAATSSFILEALTTGSQQKSGPTTIVGNTILVRFAFSYEVPSELRTTLEKTPQSLADPQLELNSCVFEDAGAAVVDTACPHVGTIILVFVAKTVDDFKTVAGHVATASSESVSGVELATAAVDLGVSTGAVLQKEGPPVCVYTRQPDKQGMIVSGTITILSLEEEALQKCLLSSLYRIIGVEPRPEGASSPTVKYLTAHTFGVNPATALRFLYETKPTTRNLDELRQDIERWVKAESAR